MLPEGAEDDIRSLDPKLQVAVNGLLWPLGNELHPVEEH